VSQLLAAAQECVQLTHRSRCTILRTAAWRV